MMELLKLKNRNLIKCKAEKNRLKADTNCEVSQLEHFMSVVKSRGNLLHNLNRIYERIAWWYEKGNY